MATYINSILRNLSFNEILKATKTVILNKRFCCDYKSKKSIFAPINVNRAQENSTYFYRRIWTREFLDAFPECDIIYTGMLIVCLVCPLIYLRIALTRDDVCYTKKKPYDGTKINFLHPRCKKFFKYQKIPPNPKLQQIYCDMKKAQKGQKK